MSQDCLNNNLQALARMPWIIAFLKTHGGVASNVQLVSSGSGQVQPTLTELVLMNGLNDPALLRQTLVNPAVKYVLAYVESAPDLLSLISRADYTDIFSDKRLYLMGGREPAQLKSHITQFFYANPFALTGVFSASSLAASGANAMSFQTALAAFNESVDALFQRLKPNEEDAFWGLINTLSNFPEYWQNPDINVFQNVFAGRTGILVGTGPSLEKSLPFLKQKRDALVICACDSALKVLQASGITPDAVVSIERLGQTVLLFEGMSELPTVPLIGPAIMSPLALAAYRGPKIRISLSHGFDSWVEQNAKAEFMVNMPSVSHLAYAVLRKMGCEKIFLLGQDLSHDPFSKRSHVAAAANYIHEAEQDLITTGDPNSQIISVTGLDGKPRRTNFYWQHFAEAFGLMIAQYGGVAWNVLPAEYGIPIPGTVHMTPEQAFATVVEGPVNRQSFEARLEAHKNAHSDEANAQRRAHMKNEQALLAAGMTQCLASMRALGTFWMSYNPMLRNCGYTERYQAFFKSLDAQLEDMFSENNNFWLTHFRPIIMNSFLGLKLEHAQLKLKGALTYEIINELIQVYYKTFNLIHLWAARCHELIASRLS